MGQVRAPFIQANPRSRIACVVDTVDSGRNLALKYNCAFFNSLETALGTFGKLGPDGIDAVWLTTPTFTHAGFIKVAASAGKDIFTEKPVDESPHTIVELFSFCKAAGVHLMCGFQRRFEPSYVSVKSAVASGTVGKVQFIRVFFGDHPAPPIEFLKKGGDSFMDLAPHDVDFVRWIMDGEDPEQVCGMSCSSSDELRDVGVKDNASVMMQFKSGAICTMSFSRSASYGYDQRCEIFGDLGLVVVETEHANSVKVSNGTGIHRSILDHSFPQRFAAGFQQEVDHFVSVCLADEGAVWPVGVDECVAAQAISAAASESSRLGKTINYEPPRPPSDGAVAPSSNL